MDAPDPAVAAVLAGNVRAIARMISRAEASRPADRAPLAALYRHAGRAHVVGLTGVPGSGKSTLVRALTQAIRADGRRVGIVAVDPSSPFSGGAILGDRVRMAALAGDPGVYIRSMATRGTLGGLAAATLDAVDVLDAAGFEVVLIETVGVGQDEVDIVEAAHTVVVVSAPGLGDDIQAIKAGVMEIADIHVVSKADRADAPATRSEIEAMLGLGRAGYGDGWSVPVIATSAEAGTGIGEFRVAIDAHRAHLEVSGALAERRRRVAAHRVRRLAEDMVRARFREGRDDSLSDLLDRVARRELDPHGAAAELLATVARERGDTSS